MKAVIFDIGKVVAHYHFKDVYARFADRIGVTSEAVFDYHKINRDALTLGTIQLDQFFKDLQKLTPHSSKTEEVIKQVWREVGLGLLEINQELLDWIDNNRNRYIIGTLTNLTYSRLMFDEEINLYSHFDFSILSCIEHLKKPDPAFYRLALKRAGVSPEDAVFVDDEEKYVAAAKEVGIKDLLYVNNELLFEELKQM